MCRIFAVIADEPVAVGPAFEGLRKLAVEHKDGWGVAHFDGPQAKVDRGIRSAEHCADFQARGKAPTRSMLVHIRLASVGSVKPENTHPFVADGWVFMHNGTLKKFAAARARFDAELAPRFREQLAGDTDSERCFALFRTYLGDGRALDDMARALVRVFHTASRICDVGAEGKRSAMNFLVGDGRRVVATRRDRTLFTGLRGGARFIASEPVLPDVEWVEVPNDHVVTVDEHRNLLVKPLQAWSS